MNAAFCETDYSTVVGTEEEAGIFEPAGLWLHIAIVKSEQVVVPALLHRHFELCGATDDCTELGEEPGMRVLHCQFQACIYFFTSCFTPVQNYIVLVENMQPRRLN